MSCLGHRRRVGVVLDRDGLQYFGGRGLHFALRCGHHGWAADDLLLQHAPRPRPQLARLDHGRRRQARAARDDDRHDGAFWIVAGILFHEDRLANAASAGDCGGGRHGSHDSAHPLPDAGALQFLRPSRAARRLRRHGALIVEFVRALLI